MTTIDQSAARGLVVGKRYLFKSLEGPRLWEGEKERRALLGQVLTFLEITHSFRDSCWAYGFATHEERRVDFVVPDGQSDSVDWSQYFEAVD